MSRLSALAEALRRDCPALELYEGEPLSAHTSFRIGGPAALFLLPKSVEELRRCLQLCASRGEKPVLLGKGSNVLAPDAGLQRPVLCLKRLCALRVEGTRLFAEAGCTLARLATAAQQAGLCGLEFAHGIPGTLGGGIVMNAGAYGGELKDVVTRVHCLSLNGESVLREGEALGFGYRRSAFEDGALVLCGAELQLQPGDPAAIRARMEELAAKRRDSQPLEYPSAGSAFKRPAGDFAARLLQDCGLKGRRVGGAMLSTKHAGFVINAGGATEEEVLQLLRQLQAEVYAQRGVLLEPEVRLWRTLNGEERGDG